jgi:hypothetical protein
MKDSLVGQLCHDIFNQLFDMLVENEKKWEIKKKLIDPLIDYYKNKLFLFYGIITVLLMIVIVTNFYIIIKLHR